MIHRAMFLQALLALLLLTPACSMKKMVADNMMGTLGDVRAAFFSEPVVQHAREAAPSQLLLLDGFVRSSPRNPDLLTAAAEMNCSFAIGMVELEDPAWASRLYEKGRDYALRALERRNSGIREALDGPPEELEAFLAANYRERDLPAVFWAGMCWGMWINVNMSEMEAVSELPRAQALVSRAMELDESYFNGGPHLFFGTMAGQVPVMLGGCSETSKYHFERVFDLTDNRFLLARVFFAKTYAVQTQQRALFISTLRSVLDAPPDIMPDELLMTAIAKEHARQLLRTTNDLFLPGADDEPGYPFEADEEDELDALLGH